MSRRPVVPGPCPANENGAVGEEFLKEALASIVELDFLEGPSESRWIAIPYDGITIEGDGAVVFGVVVR